MVALYVAMVVEYFLLEKSLEFLWVVYDENLICKFRFGELQLLERG